MTMKHISLVSRLTQGWRRFVRVDAEVEGEEARLGVLFNTLMVLSFALSLVLLLGFVLAARRGYFESTVDARVSTLFPLLFVPLSMLCYLWVKKGYVQATVRFYVWGTFIGILLGAVLFGGHASAVWSLLFWPVAIAGTLLKPRHALYFAGTALLGHGLVAIAHSFGWYTAPFTTTLESFRFLSLYFVLSMLFIAGGAVTYLNNTSLREAVAGLRATSAELELARQDLAARVDERTAELQERADQFRVVAELSQTAASMRDPQDLLDSVVEVIARRLNFHHVGLFLLDPSGTWAVLRAASSEGGRQMLARGHRLRVGEQGIVGHVAELGTARIAFDVGDDAAWFNNPDLPQTRSEIALPLIVTNRVIGVLDIQAQETTAFDDDDVETFRVLAGSIAVAIENTRLLSETQTALERLERYQQEDPIRAWRQALTRRGMKVQLGYTSGTVQPIQAQPIAEAEGIDEIERHVTDDGRYLLQAPIRVGGRTLGMLSFERSAPWSDDVVQLIEAVTGQLDLALDNARLLEESRLRANQEAARSEIVGRVRALTSTDAILRSAAEELGRALQVERSRIQLVQFTE